VAVSKYLFKVTISTGTFRINSLFFHVFIHSSLFLSVIYPFIMTNSFKRHLCSCSFFRSLVIFFSIVFIYLCIHLFIIYVFIYLFICVFIYLFIHSFICLFVRLFICLFVYLMYLFICYLFV